MSRYTDPSPLALAVLAIIQPHSSQRPISHSDILAAAHTLAPPDEVHDAIEELIDAKLISSMNHTRMGITRYVYWPTGLKPITAPSMEEIHMSAEPKNSQLARLILLHGPITGPALAEKARNEGMNCPAKNVPGLLESRIRHGDIIARKSNGVTLYMTPTQAACDEMEAGVFEAGGQGGGDIYAGDEAGAHVMSAPPASTKQSGAEIPVNETATENAELAELKARVHDLLNDVAAANLIFAQIQETLRVDRPEDIPGALDEIMRAASEMAIKQTGPLGLLLTDSEDLTDYVRLNTTEYLKAKDAAMERVDQGDAANVYVIQFLGKASRQVAWKEAA